MQYPDIPVKALSIMQPWAWLIVNGHKDIENRDWLTKYRGPVAIHAGKKLDEDCNYSLTHEDGPFHPVTSARLDIDTGSRLVRSTALFNEYSAPAWHGQSGGIVGVAEIVDCWHESDSDWFVGGRREDGTCGYGFLIRNARPVEFIPVRGALGFFDWRKNLVA